MPVPLALMAAGTVTQMLAQYGANLGQAEAERKNAEFYRMQASLAQDAMLRQERLAAFDYSFKIGEQVGNYAASGVDAGSGSASLTIAGSLTNAIAEFQAIRKKGELEMKLANSRASIAEDMAATLASPGYNLMQAATTGMKAYAGSEGFGSLNEHRGKEYTYASGGPGDGIKTTGYGSPAPSLLTYNTGARTIFAGYDDFSFRTGAK